MHITIGEIEAFSAVCEHASFREAADSIGISPPALTRRIQKLEAMLGVELIQRTTRSVQITSAGREFHRRMRLVLEELEASVLTFQDKVRRPVRFITLACPTTATQHFLPEVIAAFNQSYPDIKLRILDVSAADCLDAVVTGAADFGINFLGKGEPGITFTALQDDPFVLVCARDHPLAERAEVRWSELANYHYIAAYKESGNRLFIDARLAEYGLQIPWFYEVRHAATSRRLAERGLGVTALPRSALPSTGQGMFATVPLVEPSISRTMGIIQRDSQHHSETTRALFDLFVNHWGKAI